MDFPHYGILTFLAYIYSFVICVLFLYVSPHCSKIYLRVWEWNDGKDLSHPGTEFKFAHDFGFYSCQREASFTNNKQKQTHKQEQNPIMFRTLKRIELW